MEMSSWQTVLHATTFQQVLRLVVQKSQQSMRASGIRLSEFDEDVGRSESPMGIDDSNEGDNWRNIEEEDCSSWQTGLTASERFQDHIQLLACLIGDLGHRMSEDNMNSIRAHNFRVEVNLSAKSYMKLRPAFPNCPTFFPFPLESLNTCALCSKVWFDVNHHSRNIFAYLPLIPRLISMCRDNSTEKIKYRNKHQPSLGRQLTFAMLNITIICAKPMLRLVRNYHTGFSRNPPLSGYLPMGSDLSRSASKVTGYSSSLATISLHRFGSTFSVHLPRNHSRPQAAQNLDSFLISLIDELIKLMRGVPAYDTTQHHRLSVLRAYLITVVGDIPTVAKLMHMKGVNDILPCRACNI